jgi:hypothetical protein
MAIPWLAAFKVIPWKEVVTAAPSILEGTRKLWNTVSHTERQAPAPAEPARGADSAGPDRFSAIDTRVRALEARTTEIAREAVSSANLMRSLAEQNAQLVKAVEILRRRTRRLVWFSLVLAAAGCILFLWVVLRG